MRDELTDAVDRIRNVLADEKIYYFDGLELFGNELVDEYLPDNLHPSGDGYEIMGKYAALHILPKLVNAL